jgi:hypothetical protein
VEENRLPCEASASAISMIAWIRCSVVLQLKGMLALRIGTFRRAGQDGGTGARDDQRLVLLDEPFQGPAPALSRQHGEALVRLRDVRPDFCVSHRIQCQPVDGRRTRP